MEFDLLEMLMRSAGKVVSRDEITAALFEREATRTIAFSMSI